MRIYVYVGILALLSTIRPAWSQTAAQVQELRRQVEALEKQVQQAGRGDPTNQRVTEIGGGSRLRTRDGDLLVRIYDVSDLFQVAPPYLAEFQSDLANVQRPLLPTSTVAQTQADPTAKGGGGFGGGGLGGAGGGFFDVPDTRRLPNERQNNLLQFSRSSTATPSNRISTDSLIETITATISPSNWGNSGGPGTISKLGNSLVISTDVETHDKIEALLALFRQRWGTLRTISVRGYWLWLDDGQLAALLATDPAPAAGPRAFGLAKPEAWQALLTQLQKADGKTRPGYRAAVTCYNGQTVSTQAGSQSLVVTQIEPEVARGDTGAPQGRVAYRPMVSVVQEGAVLQVTPSATYSGNYVVLDVHSRVTRLREPIAAKAGAAAGDPAKASDAASPQQVVAAIDRPVLVTQRLSTTLRVPTERPTLIGGMSLDSEPQPGEPTLYLFALVSVQELRDDLAASQPVRTEDKPATKPDDGPAGSSK